VVTDDKADARGDDRPDRKTVFRRYVWVYGIVFAIICIGLLGFTILVLRDKPGGACEDALGPLQRVEQRVGFSLVMDQPVGNGGDSDCQLQLVETTPRLRKPVVLVVNRHVGTLADTRTELEARGYKAPDELAGGALLFHAPADASYHVVLWPHGQTLTRFDLLRAAFSIDAARGFVVDVTQTSR
jgi:hypothetical protein